jgi:thiamine-monophosphate kinase
MHLFQTGELKLLKEIRERFRLDPGEDGVIVGIGDDAAVIAPQKENIIVTTDMMNEGVHFDLDYTSPFHLGFKLVSVNVSDIMAMGGVARYIFLDLAFTRDADDIFFQKIYDGIDHALSYYGVRLLGGDLCSARSDTVLSATLIGVGGKIIKRAGASVGDKLYVTSTIGDSACGLEILKRLDERSREAIRDSAEAMLHLTGAEPGLGGHTPALPSELAMKKGDGIITIKMETAGPLLRRHLMPVARDSRGIAPYASAMLDVSDGLSLDLCRLCDESGTGAIVYRDKVPLSGDLVKAAELMGLDPFNCAVSGGEDYELLFTARDFPIDEYNALHNIKVSCIGEITDEIRNVIDKYGVATPLKSEGYQHFGPPG